MAHDDDKVMLPATGAPATAAVAPAADDEQFDDDVELGEEERTYDDSDKEGVYLVKALTDTFQIWRWKIDNFSTRPDRDYSPEFTIGGAPWRLLLFPRGNQQNKEVSVYLDCVEAHSNRLTYNRYAEFRLGAVNRVDLRRSRFQEARKRFTRQEPDWGFRQFLPIEKMQSPEQGFLVDDTLTVELRIEVKKDQFSGWAYQGYDCRKETGFVGLKNQGATCYMNSLLQTLYHIPAFRRAVYGMLFDVADQARNIPLALQRLFWQLQFSPDAPSTKQLTKSFGWGAMDSFVQHDVQELLRVLIDNLEEKMKGSPLDNTMNTMFGGKMKNFIECLHVQYESSREEPYYDLQMVVKGCKDLEQSFEKYVETEMLDGDNKYHAEGHGLQDARKGVSFLSFPPVLMLQLKRFEYDFATDRMYKINDRYEFPVDINLDRFLAPEAPHDAPNEYTLLSILVHSGDVSGGHYYAYIRPGLDQNWFKFDDERVTPATEKEAVEDNFGGEEEPEHEKPIKNFGYPNWDVPPGHVRRFQSLFKRYANAYMLVYVRRTDIAQYMRPIEQEEISEDLRQRFQEELVEEEAKKKEKAEAHLYCVVKVVKSDALRGREGFDLPSEEDVTDEIKFKKSDTVGQLKDMLAEKYGIPRAELRVWKFAQRQNYAYRPDQPVRSSQDDLSVDVAFGLRGYYYSTEKVGVFVDRAPSAEHVTPAITDLLLFVKWYDPRTSKLSFLTHMVVPQSSRVSDLFPMVREAAGLGADAAAGELLAFEETRAQMRDLQNDLSLYDERLMSGDIVVFQQPVEDIEAFEHPSVGDFFNYMVNRVVVKVCKLESPKDVEFELPLMKTMTYKEVVDAIGAKVGAPGDNIRLTAHSTYMEAPRQTSLKTTDCRTLRDMLYFANVWTDILYYEVLDAPVADIENKKEINLHYYNDKVVDTGKVKMVVPRQSTIAVLLEEFARKVGLADPTRLRLMECFNGKIQKVFKPTESVDWLHEYGQMVLRVEEVPDEEVAGERVEGERLVQIQHFQKDATTVVRCFGDPFFLRVQPTESFADIKRRIREKIDVDEEEFGKWRFNVLYFQRPEVVTDDSALVIETLKKVETYRMEAAIGMEHKDTSARSGTASNMYSNAWRQKEASIKIHN